MVSVHAHTIVVGGERRIAKHKRTAEAIERLSYRGAKIIPETEEAVDASLIDGEGRYLPSQESVNAKGS